MKTIIHLDIEAQRIFYLRLRAWKDKFKDKRCFCVGNGPSLAKTPLHLLRGEYTFGMNKIADIYPTTPWRPNFYVSVNNAVHDVGFAKATMEAIKCAPSFVAISTLHLLMENVDGKIRVPDYVYPVRVTSEDKEGNRNPDPNIWSHDIAQRVSKWGSSMSAVMQIAVYMGFNPIYLVGCDLGWKPFDWEEDKDPNHFSEGYWAKMTLGTRKNIMTPEFAQRSTESVTAAHILAKKVCDPLGVKIYNATIGGELEVHPRVDIYDILR